MASRISDGETGTRKNKTKIKGNQNKKCQKPGHIPIGVERGKTRPVPRCRKNPKTQRTAGEVMRKRSCLGRRRSTAGRRVLGLARDCVRFVGSAYDIIRCLFLTPELRFRSFCCFSPSACSSFVFFSFSSPYSLRVSARMEP